MNRHDYRGDILTVQVTVDRAHSATVNGRRVQAEPGVDLRALVVDHVARHARRLGRPLPMVVRESRAACTLLVHPDGNVEPLGLRGGQQAQRWLPAERPPIPGQDNESPAASRSHSRWRRAAPAAPAANGAAALPSRRSSLPRYGASPDTAAVTPLTPDAAPAASAPAPPQGYGDDILRLAAERLGLSPDALAAALRRDEPETQLSVADHGTGGPAHRADGQSKGA